MVDAFTAAIIADILLKAVAKHPNVDVRIFAMHDIVAYCNVLARLKPNEFPQIDGIIIVDDAIPVGYHSRCVAMHVIELAFEMIATAELAVIVNCDQTQLAIYLTNDAPMPMCDIAQTEPIGINEDIFVFA